MTALVMPQQVSIDIEYDNEENAMLSGTIGLMAKMLFSTTPGYRTITSRSAYETDVVIGRMLTKMGYTNNDQNHPVAVVSPRGGGGVWLELVTHDVDGLGWCNDQTNGSYQIVDPLYDGINESPVYADLDRYIDAQDFVDYNDIPRPHTAR